MNELTPILPMPHHPGEERISKIAPFFTLYLHRGGEENGTKEADLFRHLLPPLFYFPGVPFDFVREESRITLRALLP
jgi:hypothetical protein